MNDGDVQRAIKSALDTGLAAQSITNIKVKQNFQRTKQGAPSDPVVFFTKITGPRYGWQGRKYAYNVGNDNFDKVENWWLSPTYQINAVAKQDISDPNSLSTYDIVDLCAAILQSEESVVSLRAAGIGIEKITDIRTLTVLNDGDEYREEPSFDFVLTYNQTITSTIPKADPIELEINRV